MSKPFYFLLSALFSTTIFMTCYADTSSICAPSDCGNGVSIRYPFWKRSGTSAGEFCGYPDFGLECSKGYPVLQLQTDTYYVTDINYVNHSITLVDIDVMNVSCPRVKNNVSIGSIPLSFSNLDRNITFYFNCSSQPSVAGAVPIKCLINGQGRKSYVFEVGKDNIGESTWTNSCDAEVTVAVKHDQIQSGNLISRFGAAMSKGFVLDWSRAVDCAECELSDGYCAYNGTTRQTICICRDGRIVGKSCNKKDQLREYFAKYGTIRDSFFILDPNTTQPRGFGFVNFLDPSSVDRVIEDNSHHINGYWVGVDRCTLDGKREGYKTKRLYVYGVPPPLSSSDALAKFFGAYGRVISSSIDRGKCQGSIYFDSSKSVDDIIAAYGSWISLHGGVMMEISKYVLRRHPILLPRLRHIYKDVASRRGGDFGAQNPPQRAVYNLRSANAMVVNNQLLQPYGSYGNISGGGGANNAMFAASLGEL
ncbi:hypothetical protein PIB30_031999 [Stylosanthes scabra]|uniref:non-specific serine/threonine protein kinase n=1 Tax=Stylosanthes scabra TaxID=79078 RepID=A0ABU6VDM6_9FABA|nr:hypothetical protein [Stylosanthes scabra]